MKMLKRLKRKLKIQILCPIDTLRLKGGGVIKGLDNLEGEVE